MRSLARLSALARLATTLLAGGDDTDYASVLSSGDRSLPSPRGLARVFIRPLALLLLLLAPTIVAADEHAARLRFAYEVDTQAPRTVGIERLPDPQPFAPAPLTLADLETIALQQNPTLSVAAARISGARGRQIQASLYPNPVAGYHATEIGNFGTAAQQGGFVSQRVIMAGKRRLDSDVAEQRVRERRFQYDAQRLRVLSDVRVRFYDALVAQRNVELTTELSHISDDLVATSSRLLAAREVSENNLLQAEIEAEQGHILLDNARNDHIETRRRLAAVIGWPELSTAPLAGDLDAEVPAHEWQDTYGQILAQNPELNAARTRVGRARLALDRASREPIPNVDVSLSVRHHNVTSYDVANVQIGMPIPVFDRNQGNIRAARAQWIAAHGEVERQELKLQDRLAVAFRRYDNARQQAGRYRDRIIPRAQRSLQLVSDGFDKGQVDYLTLITSQRTFIEVSLAHLVAVRELRAAAVLIDSQLLGDSLDRRGRRY
jgi:cobalt-zinc-cadmium efflux system outer membrane protein